MLTLARNELERHGIAVKTLLAIESCRTLGDHVQIQQVVLNLVVNGIEAMSGEDLASRVLVVQTERAEDGSILVSISDSGCGLAPEDTARVFDAFFTSKVGGIGMGLSICRSIVENHGGRMTVSPNVPRGCKVGFQLPALVQERPLVRFD